MVDKNKDIVANLIKRVNTLASNRKQYEIVWQDISDYILPNRQDFVVQAQPGTRRDITLYDTTAVQANEMLAAALYSGLTSNSSRWFDLVPSDKTLINNDAVKRWLADVIDIMYAVFNSPESNFAQQNHELLLDLVALGTSCMYIDEEPGKGVRFSTRHLSEIYIAENSKGMIDTFFRKYPLTARQANQDWPGKLGKKVTQALNKNPDDKFTFIQGVMPREDFERYYGPVDLPEKFKTVSVYICEEDKVILDIEGYYEMPYLAVRWSKLVGEDYGRSPGWSVLADVKMINSMSETMIRGAQKAVSPPAIMADDGVIMPLDTTPDGVNIGAISADGKPLVQYLQSNARLDIGNEMMEQRRDAIRKGYFVDQFIQKEGTPVSATEFAQRNEDRLRLTGPQLFRLISEYLSKLVNRVFAILQRGNYFPPAPPELQGVLLNVEFVSSLVRTQKFDELVALNRAIQSSAALVNADPTVMDNLDSDWLFRDTLIVSGVPIKALRKRDETTPPATVEQLREQRAKQQQQQQLQAGVESAANAVGQLSKAGLQIGG